MQGSWEQALNEVAKLTPDQRDEVGALILTELADEREWDRKFAASQDKLSQLAAKAREDVRQGRVADVAPEDL